MIRKNLIVALDTASDAIALAVGKLDITQQNAKDSITIHPVASADFFARREANVNLLPALEALFKEHKLNKESIACVVCGRGPGSFTGVRIAVATAKGLAGGLEVPLFGIVTSDAQAWMAWLDGVRGRIAVLSDAMRGEVYPVRYRLDDTLGVERLDPLSVIKADKLAERWQGSESELMLLGDALNKYGSLFAQYTWLDEENWHPKGRGLLKVFEAELQRSCETLSQNAPEERIQGASQDSTQGSSQGSTRSSMQDVAAPHTQSVLFRFIEDSLTPAEVHRSIASLLPVYTRLSDAEENERKRLASGGALAQGALTEVPASGVAWPPEQEKHYFRPAALGDSGDMALLGCEAYLPTTSIDAVADDDTKEERDPETAQAARLPSVTSGECWTEALYQDDMSKPDRIWWVCYIHNELVGFIGGHMVDGSMQVLDVVVKKAYRRQGIARELLAHLASDAKDLGATQLTLEVRASNAAAQALYLSLGFTELGVRTNYYSPVEPGGQRENALIMTGAIESLLSSADKAHAATPTSRGSDVACKGMTSPEGQSDEVAQSVKDVSSALELSGNAEASERPEASGATKESKPAQKRSPLILAIESSCDETAAALIDGKGELLSNIIASQTDFHARFGGVVPEIASRKHTEAIYLTVLEALEGRCWQELDAIAVTYAPGLIGALVVGMAFAKGLSWATGLPLIKVDHLEGHIYANRFVESDSAAKEDSPESKQLYHIDQTRLAPPFIISLLSGGNTLLVLVRQWGEYEVLGGTLDDAIGEAYDKVAKALGLGYPGGPVIARLAEEGNAQAFDFPRALLHSHDYTFSFSGLKTAVLTAIRKEVQSGTLNPADIAASFEQAVIEVQVAKALDACKNSDVCTFCIGGGVAANTALRKAYQEAMEPRGIEVVFPPPIACTDNAAMIAAVALDRYAQGEFADLSDDAHAQADLSSPY